MSSLNAFFNPIKTENKEVIISNRFQENGKPVPFVISPILQEGNRTTNISRYLMERSHYFNLQKRVIESKLNTKEQNIKNIALWQTVGCLTDEDMIDLMVVIEDAYSETE